MVGRWNDPLFLQSLLHYFGPFPMREGCSQRRNEFSSGAKEMVEGKLTSPWCQTCKGVDEHRTSWCGFSCREDKEMVKPYYRVVTQDGTLYKIQYTEGKKKHFVEKWVPGHMYSMGYFTDWYSTSLDEACQERNNREQARTQRLASEKKRKRPWKEVSCG